MKDYFADIISPELLGVTGVTQDNIVGKEKADNSVPSTPNLSTIGGNRDNNNLSLLPPVTPKENSSMFLKFAENNTIPIVTPYLMKKDEFYYFYHERYGILQFDGNFSQAEAQLRAYQETLKNFISLYYPEIQAVFEQIIFQPVIQ